ncbi:MAG: tetratricopeptide repeat protein [Chitinophagaceae bacterium]|nr:tetratricopeptide repeat protein [Chitinophagaceae bacterium]
MNKLLIVLLFAVTPGVVLCQLREVDSLNRLLNSSPDDTTKVSVLVRLSFYENSFEHGLQLAEEALSRAKKARYKAGEAMALHQIGNQYHGAGSYHIALKYYIEALRIFEQVNDQVGTSRSLAGIGTVQFDQQNYKDALYYFSKAWQALQATDNKYFIAMGFVNMGKVYEQLQRSDSAIWYYQRGYELFTTVSDRYQLGAVLNGLGNVHSTLGNIELAMGFYRLAVANEIMYEDHSNLTKSYLSMAELFVKNNQRDSGIYYARQALDTARIGRQSLVVASAAKLLSELYDGVSDKEMIRYLQMAMNAKDSTFSADKLAQIQNLNFAEREREKEVAGRKVKEGEERKRNLQYTAIAVGLITFVILFFALSRSIIVNEKFIRFFGILGLLALFEFINLYIHPYIGHITHDSPILMLLILICIAALLIPLHHRVEKWLVQFMVEKNKKIRLASAKKTIAKLEGQS